MDSYSLGKDIQAILQQLDHIKSQLGRSGDCSCSGKDTVKLSAEQADDLLKYGDAAEAIFDQILEGSWNAEKADKVKTLIESIRASKHTYCCKLGQGRDGYYEDCTQFRCYSWQASGFCIRDARNRGYSQGSVGRGECTSPPCP